MTADDIIKTLRLTAHPEGGFFSETWRHQSQGGVRGAGTAIYFLLTRGQRSAWHRVDAVEIWHFYAGAPLRLEISVDGAASQIHLLGPELLEGQLPQLQVPAGAWQAAESSGDFTLVGCTVSPAFEFAGFELAPAGWSPGRI